MTKSALIIGITGQDGSYLAEHLLSLGYTVHGLVRRTSMFNRSRIEHLRAKSKEQEGGIVKRNEQSALEQGSLTLHYSDLTDATSLRRIIQKIRPDEIYHLAAQSHVGLSFEIPEVTCEENGMATLGLLEILRDLDYPVRFYHAGSSEMFGAPMSAPQNESTPFNSVNPYGCAKAFAAQLVRVYRQSYGLFAVNGIAYNHESPRRGESFVTRKITLGAARIKAGRQGILQLGNLDAKRDWGWAPEYVEAMWLALQAEKPQDYVLATGRACSIREFAIAAFDEIGIGLEFESIGPAEFARRKDTDEVVLKVDVRYFRPTESTSLVGDASRAREVLGWVPTITGPEVARRMARADYAAVAAES